MDGENTYRARGVTANHCVISKYLHVPKIGWRLATCRSGRFSRLDRILGFQCALVCWLLANTVVSNFETCCYVPLNETWIDHTIEKKLCNK